MDSEIPMQPGHAIQNRRGGAGQGMRFPQLVMTIHKDRGGAGHCGQ